MKIAVLIRRFITTGGAERYTVEVVRRLARKHEVHVFAQHWDHQPENMVFHRVSMPFEKPRYLNQWWFSWRTSRMTQRAGFDVVYTTERITHFDVMSVQIGTFVGGLWGTARGERKNAFYVWLKILTGPSIWAYLLLEKLHNRPAPGRFWVAASEMIKREVQQYYPLPDDRFFIAHSGIEPADRSLSQMRSGGRRKLEIEDGEVIVLFVGSEFRRKGLGTLLEAMATFGDKMPRLIVVGGDKAAPYQRQAQELGIADQITWTGHVRNTKEYYAVADIFVLPTLSDACPLAPLEAMAHGCATVISGGRYAGTAEVVRDGEAILLQDPRDPVEIAAAVERLMDGSVRKAFIEKGYALVKTLTWDRTADVILQAVEASARERGHR